MQNKLSILFVSFVASIGGFNFSQFDLKVIAVRMLISLGIVTISVIYGNLLKRFLNRNKNDERGDNN